MDGLTDEMRAALRPSQFPRSAGYDPEWVLANEMGPNVLWLTEWACEALDLKPGMRVLDLGCGKALSSVFLAREYGVSVTAADLWIQPAENARRIEAAGLGDQIIPVHAEAHSLPFAEDWFDVIVSFDAYHYFGIDDLYLGTIRRFLKPGGTLAIVVPGLTRELTGGPPEHLTDFWEWEFACFHTAGWWQNHWQRTGLMQGVSADTLPDGWRLWAAWCEVCTACGVGLEDGRAAAREAEMLSCDEGRTFEFVRVVARKPA